MGVPAGGILGFADEANPSRSLARVMEDAPTFAAMEQPVNWAIPLAWPGISTADVASGMYDSTFVAIAQTIAENQTEDFNPLLYVRLGWEATNPYPWKVFTGPDKVLDEALVQDYIDAFQHVATLFRSVDDRFQIEWNQNYSNKDSNGVFYDLNKLYPGDDFVDVVGVDAYNVARFSGQDDPVSAWAYKLNAPYGLEWFSNFAAEHGKPLALTELGIDSDNFGYYVDKLAEFARTNNVLYANYWNADARTNGNATLTDGSKPATAAAIASEFGSEGNSTLIPGKQSGLIVEAGAAADGSPLVGTSSASMWAVKADPDAGDTATFDTAGWTAVDSTHVAKNGIYGSAVLDTNSGVITYTLDNTRAATNALADEASVTDAFSVTVKDASGASTTQMARFTITGTSDNDIMGGGEGSDIFFVDTAGDQVIELFGQGVDTVRTGFTHTLAANVENLELLHAGNASGTGNELDNRITGNAGNNVLKGAAGNDAIDGRAGADIMHGGEGADIFFVDNAGDRVNELAGQGVDTVRTGFTHTLAANVENLELLHSGNASGTGNGLDNRITGNAGNNVLKGAAGNDAIDGRAGADTMHGGEGADIFFVDNAGDRVNELFGQGVDTVRTGFTHTLAANVENLELLHSGNASGTGNGLDNRITGNAGNNVLKGAAGNDAIDGRAGADAMHGGEGADIFFVDNAGDRVNELSGQGVDTVRTGFTHTLAANVENLELLHSGNASGTGNGLDNKITGNAGNNALKGAAGNDVLNSSSGADTLHGGDGNDTLFGGAGNDSFVFDMPLDADTNVDVIVDFNPVEDTFLLNDVVFTNSGLGQLEELAFALGEIATNSAQRIVYDNLNGELFYDSDGVGGVDQIQFASLTPQLAISSDDFTII